RPPKGADVRARRRTGVIASPGDRRDKDIRELGEVAARHFDALIVREDRNLRGRRPGEIAELIAAGARGARAAGALCRSREVVRDELEASGLALDRANPGDLVVLCADQVDSIVDELQSRARPSSTAGGAGVCLKSVRASATRW